VVALAAALGMAACSSPAKNSGKGGSTGNAGTAQSKLTDPAAHGPAAAIPGAKTGGTITVLSHSTPNTLDPSEIYYTDTAAIAKLLYRQETQFEIVNNNPVLVPDLTDLGTASSDGLTWTFKLQPGIKYMDGTPISAGDMAYALSRYFDRDLFGQGPNYGLQYFKDGDKYKGVYTPSGALCSCVSAPDANTLVITLAKPFPDLPYFLSFPLGTPIPKAHDTKGNYELHPWTTGPYKVDSYVRGTELKLSKNTFWDPNTDPVRHQYADAWDFKWGGIDLASETAILQGSNPTDTTSIDYGGLDASLIPKIQSPPGSNQLLQGNQPCNYGVSLDTRKIPLPVRKAIALAYPYDQINKAAGNNSYNFEPATTILPPTVPGYKKYPPLPGLTGQGPGDPAAAKAALTAANQIGFTLSYYYDNTTPQTQQVNTVSTQAFEAAGFKVKAIGVTAQEYRSKVADYTAPVNMGQSPPGWCSDWPSPSTWFPQLFTSESLKENLSWGMLSDPALDAQINQLASEPLTQSAAGWGALDQQILSLYPIIPTGYSKAANVYGTQLGNVKIDTALGMPDWTQMYVK
jgi:peptide/nickel transport system substrate-binding protein